MALAVARFMSGMVLKGDTADFFIGKDRFHLKVQGDPPGSKAVEIRLDDLKALFFVKTLEGDPERKDRNEFGSTLPPIGRPIRVTFKDGEVLVGSTSGYQPGRAGFFLIPVDENSNIERAYIIVDNTTEIMFFKPA